MHVDSFINVCAMSSPVRRNPLGLAVQFLLTTPSRTFGGGMRLRLPFLEHILSGSYTPICPRVMPHGLHGYPTHYTTTRYKTPSLVWVQNGQAACGRAKRLIISGNVPC
jgi:hypothetical protein